MQNKESGKPLIVIASSRGPFTFGTGESGSFTVGRGAGGLITALTPLAERYEVLWVASVNSQDDRRWADEHADQIVNVEGIYLTLVNPDESTYHQYYNVIANPLLWFIQHQLWDIPRSPVITQQTWQAWQHGYVAVNQLVAKAIAATVNRIQRPVIVMPQDYQLYMLPYFLRQSVGNRAQIQPFIHIPWPGPDAWRILPNRMRDALLYSLLESDRIGFQTRKDAFNFVQTCRFYLPDAHSRGRRDAIYLRDRVVEARAYPISVDVGGIQTLVEEPETRLLKSQLMNSVGDCNLILRVDRIEPSKNILRGLSAYRALLESHPEYRGKVKMMALLVPSRMEVTQYQDYMREIMAEAGLINAEYSDPAWEPVRILVGDHYPRALAAMQLYDILLVNPIADGMNLVAKEGVLVNQQNGVLILSEHAGASYELGEHALLVSPFDVYGTAEAMHRALTMSLDERRSRAVALRKTVEGADVSQWFAAQLDDALQPFRGTEDPGRGPDVPASSPSSPTQSVPYETSP